MSDLVTNMTHGVYRRLYSGATTGKRINSASLAAEFWFWRLHMICDDFGTFVADADLCRLAAAPRRDITDRQVSLWLTELERVGLIVLYKVGDDKYGQIIGFCDFQPAGKNGKRIRRYPVPTSGVRVNPGESSGIQVNPGGVQPSSASDTHTDTHTDTHADTDAGGACQTQGNAPAVIPQASRRHPAPLVQTGCDPGASKERTDGDVGKPNSEYASAVAAIDGWLVACGCNPLDAIRGEHAGLQLMLDELAKQPPVKDGGKTLTHAAAVTRAVSLLKLGGTAPRGVAYAMKCIASKLEDMRAGKASASVGKPKTYSHDAPQPPELTPEEKAKARRMAEL